MFHCRKSCKVYCVIWETAQTRDDFLNVDLGLFRDDAAGIFMSFTVEADAQAVADLLNTMYAGKRLVMDLSSLIVE